MIFRISSYKNHLYEMENQWIQISKTSYFLCLIQAKENLKTAINSRETHEGKTQQSGSNKDNCHASHTFRHIYKCQLFTQSGKHRRARAKPIAVENAYTTLCTSENSFWMTKIATPKTAQFVVMRGRKIPKA